VPELPERLVERGARAFEAKIPHMLPRYSAAKHRAIANYMGCGFLEAFVSRYEEAWRVRMIEGYGAAVRPDLSRRWRERYSLKMFGRTL
jgi:hypothetical protein